MSLRSKTIHALRDAHTITFKSINNSTHNQYISNHCWFHARASLFWRQESVLHRNPGLNTVPGTNRSSNSTRGRIMEEQTHTCLSIWLHRNAFVSSGCYVMQISINDKRPEKNQPNRNNGLFWFTILDMRSWSLDSIAVDVW